jgi:hypothetical protein
MQAFLFLEKSSTKLSNAGCILLARTSLPLLLSFSENPLPADLTSSSLQQVRRANFWRNEALEAYSIMDRVCRLMIHLRAQGKLQDLEL